MKTFLSPGFGMRRAAAAIGACLTLLLSTPRADVPFAWNELMLRYSAATRGDTPFHLEVRAYAMVHLAMERSLAAIPADVRSPEDCFAAQQAAIVTAAREVLVQLWPRGTRQFDALAMAQLSDIPESRAKRAGRASGHSAASRVLQERSNDGWTALVLLHPPAGPLPDSSDAAAATLAQKGELPPSPWLKCRPFVLKKPQQFEVAELRTFNREGEMSINAWLQEPNLFAAVDPAAAAETSDRFWIHGPIQTWNRIARQLGSGRAMDLAAQTSLLALLNVTLADATLATLHWRHTVGSWRVVIGEVWHGTDGLYPRSLDVTHRFDHGSIPEPLRYESRRIMIPPVANYPSVIATTAGAAQAALRAFFRTDEVQFSLPVLPTAESPADVAPRVFTRVSAAARECAFVATLHPRALREGCVAGYALGTSIGAYAGKRTGAKLR